MPLDERDSKSELAKVYQSLEGRSSEVQDIISAMPNNLIQYGSIAIFSVIILVVIGTKYIAYPDILPAEILITTTSPPVKVVTGSSGEINSILVNGNETVNKGHVLAIIDNTAQYDDVIILKSALLSISDIEMDVLRKLDLGELAISASQYFDSKSKLALYISLDFLKSQKSSLIAQIQGYEHLKKEQLNQQELLRQNLNIFQTNFARNKKLFDEGVLAAQQFEITERELILAKRELSTINQSISSTNLTIITLQKNISEIELKSRDEISKLEQSIEQNLRNLQAAISLWQEKYLLIAPIRGDVTFLGQWSEGQYVNQGEVLFSIDPKSANAVGKVKLPLDNSGKVKVGQKVNIKLFNYPHEEYGQLLGSVKSMSSLPNDNYYLIDVEFPYGLITSHQINLDFHQQMQGVAYIVTEDLSLFDRIFYQFKKIYYSR